MSETVETHSGEISAFTLREFIVLGRLKEGEMCGSEVVRSLSEIGDFGSSLGIGIVYPVLKNLVRDGALAARRTGGTPRIYYSLTDTGKARLRAIAVRWTMINQALQPLVEDNISGHE